MPRPPFNMMRACFWLLAVVVCVMLLQIITTSLGCGMLVVLKQQALGACAEKGFIAETRETWQEIFTAILALLLAARSQGPPPPPEDRDDHRL